MTTLKIDLSHSLSPVFSDRVVEITKSIYLLGMDDLIKYLEESGLSQRAFAEQVGVRQACVSRWVTGKAYPDWEYSLPKIVKATGGAVDANSFLRSDLDD